MPSNLTQVHPTDVPNGKPRAGAYSYGPGLRISWALEPVPAGVEPSNECKVTDVVEAAIGRLAYLQEMGCAGLDQVTALACLREAAELLGGE